MGILYRLWSYSKERQPLGTTLFFSLIYFLSVYGFLSMLEGRYALPPFTLWYVFATSVLFNFCFWLNDDIKDEAFDRVHNPGRAVVRGDVRYSDLKIAALAAFVIMVLLNLDKGALTSVCLVWILLLALWVHSFYFPDVMERSFPVTISTGGHPMLMLGNLYFYEAFRSTTPASTLPIWLIVIVCVLFAIPTMAWEIARKIRARAQETAFPSYSRKWGPRRATMIPIIYYTLATVAFLSLGSIYHLPWHFLALEAVLGGLVVTVFFLFLIAPTERHNHLKRTSELYDIFSKLIVIGEVASHITRGGAA